jgi:hypothetical protein
MRGVAVVAICCGLLSAACSVERTPLPGAVNGSTAGVSGGGSTDVAGQGGGAAASGAGTGHAGTTGAAGALDGGGPVGGGDGSVLNGGPDGGLFADAASNPEPQGYRPGAVGAPCLADTDCDADRISRTCFTQDKLGGLVKLSGGYCGTFCDVAQGGTCEPGAVCITLPVLIAPVFACMRPCMVDTDCRVAEGYSCNKPGTSNDKVCSLRN